MNAETRRLVFVFSTMAFELAVSFYSSWTGAGWLSITIMIAVLIVADLTYIIAYNDDPVFRWLLFGLAAGWVELAPDWWLVAHTRSLIYPPRELMVADSPLYMPFDWAVLLVQLGVLGDWLRHRIGSVRATFVLAIFGGAFIPLFEHLAKNAQWWSYSGTPMIFDAPYYVIFAEMLLAVPLVLFGRIAQKRHSAVSMVLGAAEGAVMMLAVWFTWRLVGPLHGAIITLPTIP